MFQQDGKHAGGHHEESQGRGFHEVFAPVIPQRLHDRFRNARGRLVYSGARLGINAGFGGCLLCMIRELIDLNVTWLRQAYVLVNELDDATFVTSPADLAPHRVGSHLRHVLEFYECFLEGLKSGRVDYDRRRRDVTVENGRRVAAARISAIICSLERATLNPHCVLAVRMENDEDGVYLQSSIGRELQALSSHTIHHFALIGVTLRLHGFPIDPEFGVSPSTLRYNAATSRKAA